MSRLSPESNSQTREKYHRISFSGRCHAVQGKTVHSSLREALNLSPPATLEPLCLGLWHLAPLTLRSQIFLRFKPLAKSRRSRWKNSTLRRDSKTSSRLRRGTERQTHLEASRPWCFYSSSVSSGWFKGKPRKKPAHGRFPYFDHPFWQPSCRASPKTKSG